MRKPSLGWGWGEVQRITLRQEREGMKKRGAFSEDSGEGKIQRRLCACLGESRGAARTPVGGWPVQHTRGVS